MSVESELALTAAYEAAKPRYKKLIEEIVFELKEPLKNISAMAQLTSRVKDTESLIEKTRRKTYSDPLNQVTDLAGVRIVCQFSEEVAAAEQLIRDRFDVLEEVDKSAKLEADRMGYQATHFIVRLPAANQGSRYDSIKTLVCEIQVKNILQDAWAQIDHLLMYKAQSAIPEPQRRELNKVSALLEIAQDVFDRSNQVLREYASDVQQGAHRPAFLQQAIDRETLAAYTQHKYPGLPVNWRVQELLLSDLNRSEYNTLEDIDHAVATASPAVNAYLQEAPKLFRAGTDFLTKSLGFVDKDFRAKHAFGDPTRLAFARLESLLSSGHGSDR